MSNQITVKILLDRAVGALQTVPCDMVKCCPEEGHRKDSVPVYGGVQKCSPYKGLCDSRKLSPEIPRQSRDPIASHQVGENPASEAVPNMPCLGSCPQYAQK